MVSQMWSQLAVLLLSHAAVAVCDTCAQEAGLVVLPYATYKGEFVKEGEYYNYTNVRYAASVAGANRFTKAVPPADLTHQGIQTASSDGHNCMQLRDDKDPAPNQDEDCLFLDVLAPSSATPLKPLPVVVYLYGGQFVRGYKGHYPGDGLLKASGNKIVYVVPNFRTGVFGFMPGQDAAKEGILNLGLLDQDFALRWIKQHINVFGGDTTRITVIGSDSGAASLLHHITAYEGTQELPFHQAIFQSPSYVPLLARDAERVYAEILANTQTANLAELKKLETSALVAVSQHVHDNTKWRPVVDGTFVPELPSRLLSQGKFHDIPIIVSRARDEGQQLVPWTFPFLPIDTDGRYDTPDVFHTYLQNHGLDVTPEVEKTLAEYYPPIEKAAKTFYNTIFGRYAVMMTEGVSACYGRALNNASRGKAWNLLFNVGQSYHADDVSYLFSNSEVKPKWHIQQVSNLAVADMMQNYVVNFATSGDPNVGVATTSPKLDQYGAWPGHVMLNLGDPYSAYGSKKVEMIQDPLAIEAIAIERCKFWQDRAWR